MLLISIILLILGLVFLIKGSGIFVGSSSQLARRFGVSEFIIGLTLVALGTSLPELTSSVVASLKGQSGLILGTIIGANIANLTLIIGITAIFSKVKLEKDVLRRDGYFLLFVMSLLLLLLSDGKLSLLEGVIFLLLYVAYTVFIIESKKDIKKQYNFADFAEYFVKFGYLSYLKRGVFLRLSKNNNHTKKKRGNSFRHYFFMIVGITMVYFSAVLVLNKALFIANYFNVAPLILGVIISIGTTMPELSVAISASSKKIGSVAIGNSIGSCITNTLLILGISAVIHPLIAIKENILMLFPFLAVATITVLIFIKTNYEISRREGILLLLLYLIFLVSILVFS
ncbi:MAG: calcium/sodium antiporter [Nanoarchaeota archaeon]|jgi:cation:H+ antiporter|nr:calcium/sodium antiporter [Nanoarchaeota archaeon]